jgi:transposase
MLRRHWLATQTKPNWGARHMGWLKQLRFEDPASQAAFDSYLLAIEQLDERMLQLEHQLVDFGSQEPYRELIGRLRCFWGIDTVTAVSIVAELHHFRRFRSARELVGFIWTVLRPEEEPVAVE